VFVNLRDRLDLPAGHSIGVALSGGGDSVALLHLLRQGGCNVCAATVDHGLRPDSGAEAARVAGWCHDWGVPHQVLVWRHGGDVPKGNLMDAARRARRDLLVRWAVTQGVDTVALGHTADDQAETLLMGLSRAAGIDGLCGLRPDWQVGPVRFTRPMLRLTRAELRDWLRGQGLRWVEDPTNSNPRFLRARLRRALADLGPLGLTPARLAESAAHLAQARRALDAATAEAAPQVLHEAAGALQVDAARLATLPPELARRLVQAAVLWISGADYPPRAADLARFCAAMMQGRAATLAGCRFKAGWIAAELRSATMARWTLAAGGAVRPLGPEGLRQCPDWRATGLPRHVLEVTPGLWDGDRLVAAPLAGHGQGPATCAPSFRDTLLSH